MPDDPGLLEVPGAGRRGLGRLQSRFRAVWAPGGPARVIPRGLDMASPGTSCPTGNVPGEASRLPGPRNPRGVIEEARLPVDDK